MKDAETPDDLNLTEEALDAYAEGMDASKAAKKANGPDAWEVATNIYGKNEEIKPEEKKAEENKKKRFPFF